MDSDIAQKVLADMAAKFTPSASVRTAAELIQSDVNINAESLQPFLPALFTHGFTEVLQRDPTNVKGSRYDQHCLS